MSFVAYTFDNPEAFAMACKHEFNYVGEQRHGTVSNRYFKCALCGCVKTRSDDGAEYLISEQATNQRE